MNQPQQYQTVREMTTVSKSSKRSLRITKTFESESDLPWWLKVYRLLRCLCFAVTCCDVCGCCCLGLWLGYYSRIDWSPMYYHYRCTTTTTTAPCAAEEEAEEAVVDTATQAASVTQETVCEMV